LDADDGVTKGADFGSEDARAEEGLCVEEDASVDASLRESGIGAEARSCMCL
jgi:hypothetical protein